MYYSGEDWIDDTLLLYLLRCQGLLFAISFALGSIQIVRVQWRLYHKFDCLKWSYSTIPSILLGSPMSMFFPLRLLWCFFIHGIRNKPVVHTANLDKFKLTQPAPSVVNVLDSNPQPKLQDSTSSSNSKGVVVDAGVDLEEGGGDFAEKLSKSTWKQETAHGSENTLLQSLFRSRQEREPKTPKTPHIPTDPTLSLSLVCFRE